MLRRFGPQILARTTAPRSLSAPRSPFDRWMVAVDVIERMTPADLGRLAPADHLRLMEGLVARGGNQATREARDKLYRALPRDPDFDRVEKPRREALIRYLRTDPRVGEMRAGWEGMSARERLSALGEMGGEIARIYGYRMPRHAMFDSPPDARGFTVFGTYDDTRHMVGFNRNFLQEGGVFEKAVGLLVHEHMHAWQNDLARAYRAGALAEADPRRVQAGLFAQAWRPGFYVDARADLDLYRAHPVERHAYDVQAAVTRILARDGFAPRLAAAARAEKNAAAETRRMVPVLSSGSGRRSDAPGHEASRNRSPAPGARSPSD